MQGPQSSAKPACCKGLGLGAGRIEHFTYQQETLHLHSFSLSCTAGGFFTNWAIREALSIQWSLYNIYNTPSCVNAKINKNLFQIVLSSVAQSCLTLCDPMNRSTPSLPVYHQLPEFTQTHVHQVSDAIQPSHPLSSPSPPAPNPSQHQSLFQWVNSSHEVAKVLEFQL